MKPRRRDHRKIQELENTLRKSDLLVNLQGSEDASAASPHAQVRFDDGSWVGEWHCARRGNSLARRKSSEGCMSVWTQSLVRKVSRGTPATAVALQAILILSSSQDTNALPAFARKYGLRCSACHESWPTWNYFGQKFKDNGYQFVRGWSLYGHRSGGPAGYE
jgi:hypothetical protein